MLGACGVIDFTEELSIRHISNFIREKKEKAQLVVYGCLAGIAQERLTRELRVLAIPPRAIQRLDEIIGASVKWDEVDDPNVLDGYLKNCGNYYRFGNRIRLRIESPREFIRKTYRRYIIGHGPSPLHSKFNKYFAIRIASGCTGECSYCAIRFAVGPLRSKSTEKVMAEFGKGLRKGHRVFRLIAQDVGEYGLDLGTNIADLLKAIFKREEDFIIFWDDFSPRWLIQYFPDLLELMQRNQKRIGYAGFPVQSGNEKILNAMKRGYSRSDAEKCLLEVKRACPELSSSTHVMVGFPGEKDEDFADTMDLLRKIQFEHILLFPYSDRPQTLASQMDDKVPSAVIRRRVRQIRREFCQTSAV